MSLGTSPLPLSLRRLALVGIFFLTALLPVSAFAQDSSLIVGGSATVSSASTVLLRSAPGYDAPSIIQLTPGTGVSVTEGPIAAADGSLWYGVTSWTDGQFGYVPSVGLVADAWNTSADGVAVTNNDAGASNTVNGEPVVVEAQFEVPAQAVGTGTIVGTNGDGANCRSGASYDAAPIGVLPEGTTVELTGGVVGEWQPVNCAGQSGFVYAAFVSTAAAPLPSADTPPVDPSVGSETGVATGYATVTGTNGDGVRCRAGASYDASIITVLGEGSQVALNGAVLGEWQPVLCGGTSGYVYAGFLSSGGAAPVADIPTVGITDVGTTDTGVTPPGAATGYATVTGTNGDGVRCRAGASYDASIITVLGEGSQVALNGGAVGEWQPVLCGGASGYVYAGFLSSGGATPVDSGTTTDPGFTGSTPDVGVDTGLAVGGNAIAASDMNLRYDASYSAGVAAVVPAGSVVSITGAAVNGFYPVTWNGMSGYMFGGYLSPTDQAPSASAPKDAAPTTDGLAPPAEAGGAAPASASGDSIVSFAMQYVGYPYVWAGDGPYGFDCSGFTKFVISNVLGLDITHDMFVQYSMGAPVGRGELQPGDLVFFQNTFQWGLSHVGIYIGGGQFVHAENESTGVKVSDLNSDYYSSRWYGAVRFG